jgi:hypothetical protein
MSFYIDIIDLAKQFVFGFSGKLMVTQSDQLKKDQLHTKLNILQRMHGFMLTLISKILQRKSQDLA